jgi:GT2 family glycosyltransferase
MDVSIIIVSYNTRGVLLDCLKSIYQNAGEVSFEVIVVDNASKDGTEDEITKLKYPNFTYIQNKQNLGFSKANNAGIKKSKGRYVLFLNPDTKLYKDTFPEMVNFMDKTKDCAAATCKVLLPNGKIDDASHRGFPTPWNSFTHFSGLAKIFPKSKIFNGYNLGNLDLAKIHEIDVLAGAFMMVGRQAGEKVGWWDEDYFFYGEDIDFCYMLKQNGWKIYYVPTCSILHLKGVSGGLKKVSKEITTADKETKKRASKARFAAMRIFYKKHYEDKYPWILTRLVYLGIFLKQLTS